MKQVNVMIGDVVVPVIEDNGEQWFPLSYITVKVLKRSGKGSFINKYNKNKYIDNIKVYEIDFGGKSNVHSTNCISESGLRIALGNTNVGRLTPEQRQSQNELHEYLGIIKLCTDEQDTREYNPEWDNEIDQYNKEIINDEISKGNVEWIRMCSKCNIHLPLTTRFFSLDNRAEKGFMKVCKVCSDKIPRFIHHDKVKNALMKNGEEYYSAISDKELPKIFEAYKKGVIKRLPNEYENKESYILMLKYFYKQRTINENNLTLSLLKELGLRGIYKYLTMHEIYKVLFGEDFYLFNWKYPKYQFREIELTNDIANTIVRNYLREHDIQVKDVLTFKYEQVLRECNLMSFTNGNTLEFIVQLNNFEYAGYKYNVGSGNYYKTESNLLFDLKYFIENDLKLEIDKIPLYLTRYTLQKKAKPLYRYIVTLKNRTLFEWVNKLYPNKFIQADFEVNAYRDEFGSDEECFIHEILKEDFKNVIYNQIHTDRTIEINGMIPDWLIITDNGMIVVEYFGMYIQRQYGRSSRITDYINKANRKIEKYKSMKKYEFLFLYPDDVEDDFIGCRKKIHEIKEKLELSTV